MEMAFATDMPLILVKAGNIRMSAQNGIGYGTVFDSIMITAATAARCRKTSGQFRQLYNHPIGFFNIIIYNMVQYLFVFIVIAASIIYAAYRIWMAVTQKAENGCTGFCNNCPIADSARNKLCNMKHEIRQKTKKETRPKRKRQKNLEK